MSSYLNKSKIAEYNKSLETDSQGCSPLGLNLQLNVSFRGAGQERQETQSVSLLPCKVLVKAAVGAGLHRPFLIRYKPTDIRTSSTSPAPTKSNRTDHPWRFVVIPSTYFSIRIGNCNWFIFAWISDDNRVARS